MSCQQGSTGPGTSLPFEGIVWARLWPDAVRMLCAPCIAFTYCSSKRLPALLQPSLGCVSLVVWLRACTVLASCSLRGLPSHLFCNLQFARARKAYVPLYAQLLRAQLNAAFSRHDLANRVAAMDKGLPENTILMFRRLAHAEVGGRVGYIGNQGFPGSGGARALSALRGYEQGPVPWPPGRATSWALAVAWRSLQGTCLYCQTPPVPCHPWAC